MGAEAPISYCFLLFEHIVKIGSIAVELQADTVDRSNVSHQLAAAIISDALLNVGKDGRESFGPIKVAVDMEVAALVTCDNVDFVNAKADNINVSGDAGNGIEVADFRFHLLGSVVGYDSRQVPHPEYGTITPVL